MTARSDYHGARPPRSHTGLLTGKGTMALSALVVLSMLFAASPYAQETEISADSMEHKGTVYNARGSVKVQRGDISVTADKVRYDRSTSEVFAEDSVFYEDPEVSIKAKKALLNFQTKTGVLYDAEMLIKKDNYHILGTEIKKTGPDRYFLKQASFTTCNAPLPAWCFKGRDIDIILGNRLKAKHASMRIKGIPVLYTPYLWAPVLTERKTGFLLPTLGYRESTGPYLMQSFFWAISENRDATLYLDVYTGRGLGEGIEYRYIERSGSKGNINFYHLGDRKEGDFYELKVSHKQTGRNVSGHLDLTLVNRREFYRLYEPYLELSSKRFVESKAEIAASSGNSRLYLISRYFIDLKAGVDESTVLQRLPEAGFFYAPRRLGPLVLTATASAVNFQREKGISGQRYSINLKAVHTAGRGLNFTQSLGARESLYSLSDSASGHGAFEYRAYIKGRLFRQYETVSHVIEPSVSYRFISLTGKEPPLLDSEELLSNTSGLELALRSRFLERKGEFITVRLTGAYDFLREDKPFLPIGLDVSLQRPVRLRATISYDVHTGSVITAESGIKTNISGASFSAGQSYTRGEDIMLYTLGLGYTAARFAVSSRLRYDPEAEVVRELSAGLRYRSQCWGTAVDVVKRPVDFGVFLTVTLAGGQ